ncbi:MAG: hypothetical protein JSR67_11450 [Proteobacteria bacterium]|nr:hypothetical protein [Pseudomonadota bacterium]
MFNRSMNLTAMVGITALIWSAAASAQTAVDDPLHGFCYGTSACSDNGTVTPVTGSTNPLNFGFSISPGPQTGSQYLIDILVPNNEALPASYGITGTQGGVANNAALSGTANLFSATAWTGGNLYTYLGLSPLGNGAPKNPLDAWLTYTQGHDDPGATGYFVFQVDLGANQLMANSNEANGPLLQLAAALDPGSVITGFLNTGTIDQPNWISTAQSGGIYVGGGSPPSLPEPGMLTLMGTALALFMGRRLLTRRALPMMH